MKFVLLILCVAHVWCYDTEKIFNQDWIFGMNTLGRPRFSIDWYKVDNNWEDFQENTCMAWSQKKLYIATMLYASLMKLDHNQFGTEELLTVLYLNTVLSFKKSGKGQH